MNPALSIPEVIRLVCNELDIKSSRATALTCRALLEPSLDRLWHTIETFEPFISCLPPIAFNVVREEAPDKFTYLTPSKNFTQDHLQRYLTYYAPRIRSFTAPYAWSRTLSNEFLLMLQLMTDNEPGALAPLARKVLWRSPISTDRRSKANLSAFVSLFVGTNVEDLTIPEYKAHPLYKASVHANLKRISNQLKTLRVSGNYDPITVQSCITPHSWDSLRVLKINALSSALLQFVASLPRLHTLEISDSGGVKSTLDQLAMPLVSPPGNFASLRVLSVGSQLASGAVWKVLKYLPSTNRVESVKFISDFMAPASVGQGIIEAIVQHCNPKTLKSVVLVDEGLGIAMEDPGTEDSHFDEARAGAPLDVMSLEAFPRLEVLTLRWSASIQLTPQEMGRIPTTWPRIRHLDLCPPHYLNGRVPGFNHIPVLNLLKSCNFLDYLGLRFDTTQLTDLDGLSGEPSLPTLRTLRVGDSPISSPSRVLTFMKNRFPKLRELDINYDALDDERNRPTLLDRRWSAVVDGLDLKN